jgi:hypothetical protein
MWIFLFSLLALFGQHQEDQADVILAQPEKVGHVFLIFVS